MSKQSASASIDVQLLNSIDIDSAPFDSFDDVTSLSCSNYCRCIIAGPRYRTGTKVPVSDINLVYTAVVNSGWLGEITHVISGGAIGIDRLGEQFARQMNLPPPMQFLPEWYDAQGRFIPRAGFTRNHLMCGIADRIIVIWDGVSGGSRNMIEIASCSGKPLHVEMVELS